MKRTAKAFISWVPRAKGGRTVPPAGPSYAAPCRFADDREWPNSAWTLVVRQQRAYADGAYWFAEVEFLVPEAPQDLLVPDGRFELYEGRRLVATGVVRDVSATPPVEAAPLQAVLLS